LDGWFFYASKSEKYYKKGLTTGKKCAARLAILCLPKLARRALVIREKRSHT